MNDTMADQETKAQLGEMARRIDELVIFCEALRTDTRLFMETMHQRFDRMEAKLDDRPAPTISVRLRSQPSEIER